MIGWFEIAVTDMERAKTFYENVFKIEINVMNFGGTLMGWFPNKIEDYGANGSLIQDKNYEPSQVGTLVYFMSENVDIELNRVEAAGGKVQQAKTKISDEHGFMAVFTDTEGNRIALHSQN